MQRISFQVPLDDLSALMEVSQKLDISVGQVLRSAVKHELRRRHPTAKRTERADEQLLARLRALLAAPLAETTNWAEFNRALEAHGYEARASGGGLALYHRDAGAKICKFSELGFSYAGLVRLYGAAFPNHPQQKLAERYLGQSMEVIEPFGPTGTRPRPRA